MAVFSRVKTWVSNEVLTASDLNAEFDNILNNMTPSGIEDASADIAAMQTSVDPGGVGTESLATTLLGEIHRLRFVIKRAFGAQWYSDPGRALSAGNLSVQTADIAAGAVTTAKLADTAVTTAKITDVNITTAKIANGAITPAKKAALGQQISSSCSNFSQGGSVSTVDVTNLTVTITTTGRPVCIALVPDGDITNPSSITLVQGSGVATTINVEIDRDATHIALFQFSFPVGSNGDAISWPPGTIFHIEAVAAGTYTYKLRVIPFVAGTIIVNYCKLIAYEM